MTYGLRLLSLKLTWTLKYTFCGHACLHTSLLLKKVCCLTSHQECFNATPCCIPMFTDTDTGKMFQKGKHGLGSRHKAWAAKWTIYSIKIQCTCMQNKCTTNTPLSSNNNKQIPKQKQNSIVLWHLDNISLKAIMHDDMIDGYILTLVYRW